MSLTTSQIHLLRLIREGQAKPNSNGWAPVSDTLWSIVSKLPPRLIELNESDKLIRLTSEGETIVDFS